MAVAIPQAIQMSCPRCRALRKFVAIDGGALYRCGGCEWQWSFGTQAPTGTATAVLNAGGTAITVASGGASFTNGMLLAYDTGQLLEILTVNGSATATNIPVTPASRSHLSAVTFGQLLVSQSFTGFGVDGVTIPNPPYGF
ncbi:MAG TPA: hypothetical protein VEV45_21000 [Streptosporangiaceae bacterium]|nr:hypothetical protein [Streptosporangiaceae bacterium]